MLALLSDAFGEFQDSRMRVTDELRARTAGCDREFKSQYRQEVAHERNPCTRKKLRFEFLSTRRKTGVKRQKSSAVEFFYVSSVAGKMIPVPTGSLLALDFFYFIITYGEYEKRKYCFHFFYTCVCVCVCACVRVSTFETPITHKRLEISIWNLVYEWSIYNPLIVTIFMTIDARFVILWDFEFCEKNDVVALTFVKFERSSQNYTQIYFIHPGTLVLSLAKID